MSIVFTNSPSVPIQKPSSRQKYLKNTNFVILANVDKILVKNCQSNKRHIRNNVRKPLRTENRNRKKTGSSHINIPHLRTGSGFKFTLVIFQIQIANLPGVVIVIRSNSNFTNFFNRFRHLLILGFAIEYQ